jgi:hypothetical protein
LLLTDIPVTSSLSQRIFRKLWHGACGRRKLLPVRRVSGFCGGTWASGSSASLTDPVIIDVYGNQVPAEVAPRELEVRLQPFSVRVGHRRSGEVYLEGELERGIVPHDSVWMHGQGGGEDGCLLLLRKMNLELLRKCVCTTACSDPLVHLHIDLHP